MRQSLPDTSRRFEWPSLIFGRNFDSLFEDFFPHKREFDEGRLPKIDVKEYDGAVHVIAEVPGIEENDLNITLSDNMLTISGKKKDERKENKEGFIISERFFGSFIRKIRLPEGINQDAVKAEFKNGVLSIELPLVEAKRPKKIAVN